MWGGSNGWSDRRLGWIGGRECPLTYAAVPARSIPVSPWLVSRDERTMGWHR